MSATVAIAAGVLAAGGCASWVARRRGATGDPLRLAITGAPPSVGACSCEVSPAQLLPALPVRGACPGVLVVHADGSSECHGGRDDCWDARDGYTHERVQPCHQQSHGCGRQCATLGVTAVSTTSPQPAAPAPAPAGVAAVVVRGEPVPDPTAPGRWIVRCVAPGSATETVTVLDTVPGRTVVELVPAPARSHGPRQGVA